MTFNKIPYLLLYLLISVTFIWSCEQFNNNTDETVLARVGSEVLTLEAALESIPEDIIVEDTMAAIKHFQQSWVERKVLEKEAVRIGLNNNRQFNERMERLKSQLLQSALQEAIINQHRDELDVSFEEAQNYYHAHKDRFILDERYVRFRHMIARSMVDADNAKRELMRGDSWEDVANSYSVNPELQIRHAERFVPISMAANDVPSMNRFLNVIGLSEISPIQQYGGHFHFVQLLEERPEGDHPDLDWLMEQISEWLYLERSQRIVNSYKRNLYLQAEANNDIELNNIEDFDSSLIINVLQHINN
jgi:hypothetical protein